MKCRLKTSLPSFHPSTRLQKCSSSTCWCAPCQPSCLLPAAKYHIRLHWSSLFQNFACNVALQRCKGTNSTYKQHSIHFEMQAASHLRPVQTHTIYILLSESCCQPFSVACGGGCCCLMYECDLLVQSLWQVHLLQYVWFKTCTVTSITILTRPEASKTKQGRTQCPSLVWMILWQDDPPSARCLKGSSRQAGMHFRSRSLLQVEKTTSRIHCMFCHYLGSSLSPSLSQEAASFHEKKTQRAL